MHTFILRALRQLHKISSSEDLTGADYGGSLYLNCIGSGLVRRVLGFFRIISYKRYPTLRLSVGTACATPRPNTALTNARGPRCGV